VVAIARKKERLRFPDSPDGRSIAYNFESLDFKATERKLDAFYAEFEPIAADKSRPHQHPGAELLYLISGKLDLTIGSRRSTSNQGTPCTLIRECVTAITVLAKVRALASLLPRDKPQSLPAYR